MIINMIMNMTIYDIGELTLDAAEKEKMCIRDSYYTMTRLILKMSKNQ